MFNDSRERVTAFQAELNKLIEQGSIEGRSVVGLYAVVQYSDGHIYPHLAGSMDYFRAVGMTESFLRDHCTREFNEWINRSRDEDGELQRLALQEGL